MKRVLVTGGAGYTGSVLIRKLLFNNYRVRVFDNLRFGGESLLGVLNTENFEFIKGDITDYKDIKSVVRGVDCVVHLAAIVGDPACEKEPQLARKVNYEYSTKLFELSRDQGVERFIFASTCSNYGRMTGSDGYVNEESELRPVSLYAELKVAFERYILDSEKINSFYPTSLRFATVYGVSPRIRFDLTVNEFTREVAMGRKLTIYGEQFWRPYCHVEDEAAAIIHVLEANPKLVDHEVYNVGDTRENYTKKMIADILVKYVPDARIEYVHKEEDPRDYRVSFEKIKEKLGFSISKNVEKGVQEILFLIKNNLITNPDAPLYKNT